MDKILVSAYGTLRPGYGNNRLLVDSTHIGEGSTVEKYTMTASGIPYVSKRPLHNIVVDVYEVSKDTLKRLDQLEGHPEWYKREVIPVKVNGEILNTWLYFNEGYSNLSIVPEGNYKNIR